MKKILLLLITIFTIGCGNEKENKFVKKFQGMHGKPTEYKETVYEASEKFDEILLGELESSKITGFTNSGTIRFIKEFNKNGELISCYECEYRNEDAHKTSYKRYEYQDGKSSLTGHSEDELVYENGEHKYTLSEDKISNTNSKIDIIADNIDKYQTQGVNEDGKKYGITYLFDHKKRQINIIDNFDGDESKTEEYYDVNWNLIEVKSNESPYGYSEGKYWVKYKYDEKNLIVEEKQLWEYGDLLTYKYTKFDDKDNWIEKVEYEDGEIKNVYIREITY